MENHAEEKPHRCPKCPASFNIPVSILKSSIIEILREKSFIICFYLKETDTFIKYSLYTHIIQYMSLYIILINIRHK